MNMESKFTGGVLGLLGTNILMVLLIMVTIGIGLPWALCMKKRWVTSHTIIEGKQLVFEGKGGSLFGHYIKWFLLTLITFGIYGLWVPIKLSQWTTERTKFVAAKAPVAPPTPAAAPAAK